MLNLREQKILELLVELAEKAALEDKDFRWTDPDRTIIEQGRQLLDCTYTDEETEPTIGGFIDLYV